MAKRANDEGTVYRRKSDGRYVAAVVVRDPATGSASRSVFYARTRGEALRKLREAQDRVDVGMPAKDATMTVRDWLTEWTATSLEASPRKESTKELYRHLIRHHLLEPPFGSRRLDQLRPAHIEALLLALRSKTRERERGSVVVQVPALADSTVQRLFSVLRVALDGAVRDGLLARNPAHLVRQPAVQRKEARFLSPADVGAILDRTRGSRYAPVLTFIAHTGVRKGEALGLRWDDVDFARGTIRIRSTLSRTRGQLAATAPKTPRSRRLLPMTPAVAELLRTRRAEAEADGVKAESLWTPTDFVFTSQTGAPLDPRNVLRALTTAAAAAGLEGVTVHTFRHSAATGMLEAGIHLKAVSELLGHSDIRITGDVYGHVSTETARAALEALSDRLAAPPLHTHAE